MVVPVELDPGRNDPMSPYYEPTRAERERREYEREKQRAEEKEARGMYEAHLRRRTADGMELLFVGDD